MWVKTANWDLSYNWLSKYKLVCIREFSFLFACLPCKKCNTSAHNQGLFQLPVGSPFYWCRKQKPYWVDVSLSFTNSAGSFLLGFCLYKHCQAVSENGWRYALCERWAMKSLFSLFKNNNWQNLEVKGLYFSKWKKTVIKSDGGTVFNAKNRLILIKKASMKQIYNITWEKFIWKATECLIPDIWLSGISIIYGYIGSAMFFKGRYK